MKFSNKLPNLKIASRAFNLVSKFASCLVAATDIAQVLIFTIPNAE